MATDCPVRDACDVLRIEPPRRRTVSTTPISPSILRRSVFMSRPTFVRAGAAVIAVAAATSLAACSGGGGGGGRHSARDTPTLRLNAHAGPGGHHPPPYPARPVPFFRSVDDP